MKIIPLKLTLLSPLFNYSQVTNGGAITSDFIGDIALTYALNRVLKEHNFYKEVRDKPNYREDLNSLDYLFTVAKPLNIKRTGIYTRNTLFNWDGGPQMKIMSKSQKNPGLIMSVTYKDYFKVQGIQIGSEYSTYLICKDDFNLKFPITIRLGTGRECLATLEKRKIEKNDDKEIWLNAYVLKEVLNEEVLSRFIGLKHYFIDYKLENYILLKKLNEEQVKTVFQDQFQ
jgi:CRISPR-associated protein Csc1